MKISGRTLTGVTFSVAASLIERKSAARKSARGIFLKIKFVSAILTLFAFCFAEIAFLPGSADAKETRARIAPRAQQATVFSSSTPVAISPVGTPVVTSTITVSGLETYLTDVDVQTFITHTFSSDIDMTVQSPAGTVVTLTTGNGSIFRDVFNGTVWDDDANPGGQVPYSSSGGNNGLVTDHLFGSNAVVPLLTPEEALAAFRGENPNGTWKLTISDNSTDDGGSLNGWNLSITASAQAAPATIFSFSNSTPVAISGGTASTVTSAINVSGVSGTITKTALQTFLRHDYSSDVQMTIQSPAGTVVTLTSNNSEQDGSGDDDVYNGTVWDDDANPDGQVPYITNSGLAADHPYSDAVVATPLTPEEPLGAFVGENPNGTWTLTVADIFDGDGGSLDSWNLTITAGTFAPTAAPAFVSGRVVSASGRSLAKAAVSLTDMQGNISTQSTDIFGRFKFDAVAAGEIYILHVAAKGYRFDYQVISVDDNLADVTLTASPLSASFGKTEK